MSEQVRILSFYENWVDIMEMCNPEEWYELSTIITNLRFKNIDTDPKTLTNIKVKMAWTAIRPSILKSNRNTRYQENKAKKNTDITPNEEFDNTTTTVFPTKIEEEQQTDTKDATQSQTIDSNVTFDNYSKDLNDFLDENEQRINGWVNAITNGIVCKSSITEFPKEMAIKNIEKIIADLGTDTKDALDFKEYMTETITDSITRKRYERAIQSSYNS